jgi:serine/threonine protein kinase
VNGSVYFKLKILGKGGSGKVYKILRNDGKIFALKKNKVEKFTIEIIHNFVNEIVVLKLLSRKSKIIRIEDAEVNFKKQIVYIILEFGESDLETFLAQKKYSLDFYQLKVFWGQILAAVKEIHDERIVHGDLKPSNFLFIEKNLKLIDFGISKPIGNNTTNITRDIHIGTINYMSPEAILEIPGILENVPKFKTSRSSDVWSLGCILFQLSHGYPPFKNFSIIQKIHAIINDSLKIKYISDFPSSLIDVIKNCLRRHPDFRATVDELSRHPFINCSGKFLKEKNI